MFAAVSPLLHRLAVAAVPCLLAQTGDLEAVLRNIEQTRTAPYAQRAGALNRLRAIRTDAARRAALELFRRETHPSLCGLLLEHAAKLPGLFDTMRDELVAGRNQQTCTTAARYIVRQRKAAGIDLCISLLVDSRKPAVQEAVLIVFAERDEPRAVRAFQRAFDAAPATTRYRVLLRCRGKTTRHLDAVRRASLSDRYAPLKGEAIRQLAEAGDRAAIALARELADGDDKKLPIASTLFEVLAAKPLPADLPRLARLYAAARSRLQSRLRRILPGLVKLEWVTRWAVADAPKDKDARVRGFAMHVLEHVRSEEAADALLRLTRDPDPELRRRAVFLLARRQDRRVVPVLEKTFKEGTVAAKLDALEGLDAVLGGDADFRQRLIALAQRGPLLLRIMAVELGARHGLRELLGELPALLANRDWRARVAAIELARQVRDKSSIPLLIRTLAKEKGRLAEDARRALAGLTRLYFHEAADWQRWWDKEGAAFELPPPEKAQQKKKRRGPARQVTSRTSATFYGIPVISERVIYCLDVSGSMNAQAGSGSTRLKVAQAALIEALRRSPRTSVVNVIFFETRVDPYAKKVVSLKQKGVLARLSQFINKQTPRGGTNIHAALLQALEDERVDTIYLLSDGAPSAGAITDIQQLADDIRRRNRTRKIVIHGISIGTESRLLERLAAESGGLYRRQ